MSNTAESAQMQEPYGASETRSWRNLGIIAYIKIVTISALFLWFYSHDIYGIVYRWFHDSSWSHGILIPFFSLYFLYQRKDELLNARPKPNYLGLVFLLGCLVFYVLNFAHFKIGYFQQLVILATLGSIVLFLGGIPILRFTWLPIGFLFFAIPLPQQIYGQLTIPMRIWASKVSAVLLSALPGVKATASGVIIDVIENGVPMEPSLNVAEACSGMRLLMAFVALGVAMAYLHYRPVWQRIVLLLSTVPIAILCNIIRVTVTGLIYIKGNPIYAQGIYHDLLGMVMLPLAFIFYYFLAWFMANLFEEENETKGEEVIIRRGGPSQSHETT